MKQTFTAAALLAVGATAQNSTSTLTSYYNTCTTPGILTATTTDTWCGVCEQAGMTSFAGGSITSYVTAYKQVCPTDAARLEDATYTVTEPCPSTGLARGPSYIPQGFTVATVSCSACEAGKSQYAQTTPGPSLASALATPAAAPAVPTSPAGGSAPAAAQAPGAGGAPAAPGPAGAASPANAENAAAAPASSAAPYPLPSQAGQVAAASGTPASNGTVPFTGTANIISVGVSTFITALAVLIAGFAFVL